MKDFNKYRHAMKIRGELEDVQFNGEVLSTTDIKYKQFIGKTIHYEDFWNLWTECTEIILEALDKAKKWDEYQAWVERNEEARKQFQTW